jgi:hypothetical protein
MARKVVVLPHPDDPLLLVAAGQVLQVQQQ